MRGGGTINADGFGVGWYPRPGGERRSATAARRRSGRDAAFADLARGTRSDGGARRRPLGHGRHAGGRDGGRAVRRRAVAVQPQRRGPRLAGRRWPALAAALPVTDLLTLDAPTDAALLWALVRHRLRAGDDPAEALADVVADGRRRGARARGSTCCSPTARRSWPPPGTTRCPCAPTAPCGPRRSEPLDDDPAWTGVPDRHLVVARPGRRTAPDRTHGSPMNARRCSTSTSPTDDAAAALRADVRAGLTATPEVPAAEVVLRRPRQRAVRGDHPAARVLPDPRRAGAPGRRASPRSPRSRGRDTLVELGSGSSEKTRLLLDALAPGRGTLRRVRAAGRQRVGAARRAATRSPRDYPGLRVHGVVGDFTRHLDRLPGGDRRWSPSSAAPSATCVPAERAAFLPTLRAVLRAGRAAAARHRPGQVTRAMLVPAYDDAPGVTAEFNRNVLHVLNRELGADFDVGRLRPRRALGRRPRVDRDAAAGRSGR